MTPRLLASLALRRPVGLYVTDTGVTVARVALTPLGPVELSCETLPCDAETVYEVVGRAIRPYVGRHASQLRLALGLPVHKVFFGVKAVQAADREASPIMLLHEMLRSTDVNPEELEIDLVKRQPDKKLLAIVAASRRKDVTDLVDLLKKSGVRPHRAEPAPFALLRLGQRHLPTPRKASCVVRVFLGAAQGVALLVHAGVPLAWRAFELPAGTETGSLLSTVMGLQVSARHYTGTTRADAVLVHGRPDLAELFRSGAGSALLGGRVLHAPEPAYDARSVAVGLALGCREGEDGFDLARSMKQRPPLWQVIPYAQIAAQLLALGGLTVLLDDRAREVRNSYGLVHEENAAHTWLTKLSDPALNKEKADLEAKLKAVREYLGTRILWSTYTRDASARLTESMVIRSLVGINEFGGEKARGKSLVLSLSAPIPPGKTMPREIDRYLDALRTDQALKRDFPRVELAGLRWTSGTRTDGSQANFTVNCLPRADKPAPPREPAAAKAQ